MAPDELVALGIEDVRMVSLERNGRWWFVFREQTPLSNSRGCAGS